MFIKNRSPPPIIKYNECLSFPECNRHMRKAREYRNQNGERERERDWLFG